MLKLNIQQFAESAGDTAQTGGGSDTTTGSVTIDASKIDIGAAENAENGAVSSQGNKDTAEEQNPEIARLKAELAKQKLALDKANKEAGDARKALKAKMTQEEIDAQAKQEAADRQAQELEDLRKQVAKGNTVKSVMGKLGINEEAAGNLADHLYGAADIDNALLEIQKAWQARETELRREYGKIPGPGTGADSNSPEAQAVKRASEIGKARNAVNEQAQKAMSAYIR